MSEKFDTQSMVFIEIIQDKNQKMLYIEITKVSKTFVISRKKYYEYNQKNSRNWNERRS